jgi:hypothetical protein
LTRAEATGGADAYGPRDYVFNAVGNPLFFEGPSYQYDPSHKHAVRGLGGTQKFWYDANGNMTLALGSGSTRQAYAYDAENRLSWAMKTTSGATLWITNYGYAAGGWTSYDEYPRGVGDVSGDGKADIVGFGQSATFVSLSTGSSFGAAQSWVAGFAKSQGWTSYDGYPRTVGDANGDGKADVVGFGQSGTFVALSTGSSFGAVQNWIMGFAKSQGWTSQDTYPRTVGDVNGDGKADAIGFGKYGVNVSLSTGSAFTSPSAVWIANYGTDVGGWTSQNALPRLVGDVNGDGKADVVGFGNYAVFVSLSTGSSFAAPEAWTAEFSKVTGGWTSQDEYPRFLADMNGDGLADIVGCRSEGTWVALSTGHSFERATLWYNGFSYLAGGWVSYDQHPRAGADATGDGRAELVGFGQWGTQVVVYDGCASFLYDGDGKRVRSVVNGAQRAYVGGWYEWDGTWAVSYYHFGGRRVAMRTTSPQDVHYLYADQLGSMAKTSAMVGSDTLERYYPYGGQRGENSVVTPYRFTGQRWEEELGLYCYKARWYEEVLLTAPPAWPTLRATQAPPARRRRPCR